MNEHEMEEAAEREAQLDADDKRRADEQAAAEKRGWPVDTADGRVMIVRNLVVGQRRVLVAADGTRYRRAVDTDPGTREDAGPPDVTYPPVDGQESLAADIEADGGPDKSVIEEAAKATPKPRARKKTTTKEE